MTDEIRIVGVHGWDMGEEPIPKYSVLALVYEYQNELYWEFSYSKRETTWENVRFREASGSTWLNHVGGSGDYALPTRCVDKLTHGPCSGVDAEVVRRHLLAIYPDGKEAPTHEEQTPETKEKAMTKYNSEIQKGIEQAVADEVSEALFAVAAEILGDSLANLSPAGRELAKAGVAIGLATLVQHLPQLPVPRAQVEHGASLQIQTATMRLVQPHVGKLRELAVKMAGTVTSSEPVKEVEG